MVRINESRKNGDAQLHTLEGVAASLILLLAIAYVYSAFVVTPTSSLEAGTNSKEVIAQDLMESSVNSGHLKEVLLYWNDSEDIASFNYSTNGTYYYEAENPDPGNLTLGKELKSYFTERGLSYNLVATYVKKNGERGTMDIVRYGEPGTSSVSASQTIILDKDDMLMDGTALENTTTYPIPESGVRVYNRVNVRLTVW